MNDATPAPPVFRGQQNDGGLGRDLNLIAKMIRAGFGTRIFYVTLGSFDTHAKQSVDHPQLLQQVADAVKFFETDIRSADAKYAT